MLEGEHADYKEEIQDGYLGCFWQIMLCGEEAVEKSFLEERRCISEANEKWF
ncbi:hypothetical protein [Laceyella sacchari]|jgi:hypothetical protein|uniref:Uncharacterized protein n=1 Tax=Laceyella sacchari TaxID=37482 RepID=A0ABY5U7K8_LACSH|nr:hypothetical protein [Laceyella sacchari]UWE04023.1 hypothetical protein NYR52_02325 [Laceyella sacchari]